MSTKPQQVKETETLTGDMELPEGWGFTSINALCSLIRGVSYEKGEASSSPLPGRVALLRANNINENLTFEDLQYVPKHRVSSDQMLRVGDVVLAMSSGSKSVVGKAANLDKPWNGTFGAFCGVLRPSEELDWRYFGLFFKTRRYRDTISGLAAGVNINNLKREYFEQIELPVAPFPEQKRISRQIAELLCFLRC